MSRRKRPRLDRFALAGEPLEDRRLLAIEILNVPIYTQGAGTPLEIELGGYAPGPGVPADNGYDRINVAGAAAVGGTLQVALINDFVPVAGRHVRLPDVRLAHRSRSPK